MRRVMRTVLLMALFPLLASDAVARKAGMDVYEEWIKLDPVVTADFEGGEPEGWRTDNGSAWSVSSGSYVARTKEDDATVSLFLDAMWTNTLVEASYELESPLGGAGGIVVRASDDFRGWVQGSGYLFMIGSDGETWQYAIYRQVNGSIEHLESWSRARKAKSDKNRLAVLSQHDLLQFFINGNLVWEGRDDEIDSGYVGLVGSTSPGQDAKHMFDNVSIRSGPVDEEKKDEQVEKDDKSPLLRPGLLIRVSVLVSGKREIDAEVKRVTEHGQLDLPLIGNVDVAGKTLRQLNDILQVQYRDYFVNPQVVTEFVVDESPDSISPWGSVVVLGRVRAPGRVNIPPTQDLTVSGAIQQAGGLDTSAKISAIRVTRRKPDGGTERVTIDFSSVGTQGYVENDLTLQPGDVIFVPERIF